MLLDQPPDLTIDLSLGGGEDLGRTRQKGALVIRGQDGDRADPLAHPPTADQLPRDLSELLDVGLRPVLICAKTSSSATRPPSATRTFAVR